MGLPSRRMQSGGLGFRGLGFRVILPIVSIVVPFFG